MKQLHKDIPYGKICKRVKTTDANLGEKYLQVIPQKG